MAHPKSKIALVCTMMWFSFMVNTTAALLLHLILPWQSLPAVVLFAVAALFNLWMTISLWRQL